MRMVLSRSQFIQIGIRWFTICKHYLIDLKFNFLCLLRNILSKENIEFSTF